MPTIPTILRRLTAGALGLCAAAAMPLAAGPADALTLEERRALDLSEYTVTDPGASYFDVAERRALLDRTRNPMLLQIAEDLKTGPSCAQLLALPPLDHRIRIPAFYPQPDAWRVAAQPLFQFEDSVTELAGSYVASGDPYYAECLVTFLDKWAQADALMDFHYTIAEPQAWYSTESMIFAAALAYSIVRNEVEDMHEQTERVDEWMRRLAKKHSVIPGEHPSCCNNHFYRRALYAAMIGVMSEDDDLFRFGVSAIYSALHDMTDEGAMPLEMQRGRRAMHYQNYALLYLIPIMQIVERQGYDVFEMTVNGNSIHDAVRFAINVIEDPQRLGDLAPADQYKGFLLDDQYFAWMEIYLSRFDNAKLSEFIRYQRPVYNRSAGGYVTLYFMDPDAQIQTVARDKRKTLVTEGEEAW
ncbi:alginate lyase family protein [Caenispirillum salinarum]|uniref:alginate lyase family protein n=1 Tax=Caenispirillum salinarum TaxID=859058 RepID=UPI00384F54D4